MYFELIRTQQRLSETDSVCVPKKRNPLAHEKKFVCKHCGRRFLTNIGLEKHFIEHGKWPPICIGYTLPGL